MDGDFPDFVAAQTRPLLGLAHALTADPHDADPLRRAGELR